MKRDKKGRVLPEPNKVMRSFMIDKKVYGDFKVRCDMEGMKYSNRIEILIMRDNELFSQGRKHGRDRIR